MDTSLPRPLDGRSFQRRRRIRLADMDARGRLRLDAVARFLQDVAIDDVEETGWGAPDHLWFVRRIRADVLEPFLADREVELTTWCSGVAALAAGRRWSLHGDRGGRIEVDSVWIHLGPDQSPQRIEGFGVYTEAAGDRRVSTKLLLPEPSAAAPRAAWALRSADVDLHGHLNNAAYWQAVEHHLGATVDLSAPLRAELDYRHPIDLGDRVDVALYADLGGAVLAFLVGDLVAAVARVEALP
jgi:acyl-ACP thioesterase